MLQQQRYAQEDEENNIEYKKELLLDGKDHRYWGYVSQMNGRLVQGKELTGHEEAIYYIGLNDNGTVAGITNDIMITSDKWLNEICNDCNAKIINKKIKYFIEGKVCEYTIKRVFEAKIKDTKIGFLGDSGVGKTTIISVLFYGDLDDGDGNAKYELFKHAHEMKTGITSSITQAILGIKNNKIINMESGIGWDKIANTSDKIIKMIDLPGDSKFEKTTLFGILAHQPDIMAFIFSIDKGISKKMKQYLQICKELNKKIIFIINKNDIYCDINKNKIIDFHNEISKLGESIPVFKVNTIKHEGLTPLINYLQNIEEKKPIVKKKNDLEESEFIINEVFRIPHIGTVVYGIVNSGTITTKNKMWMGPINDIYEEIKIISIHNEYRPCEQIENGFTASLLLDIPGKELEKQISKNNLLVNENLIEKFKNAFCIAVPKKLFDIVNISSNIKLFMSNIYESIKINEKIENDEECILKVSFVREGFYYLIKPQKIVIKRDEDLFIAIVK